MPSTEITVRESELDEPRTVRVGLETARVFNIVTTYRREHGLMPGLRDVARVAQMPLGRAEYHVQILQCKQLVTEKVPMSQRPEELESSFEQLLRVLRAARRLRRMTAAELAEAAGLPDDGTFADLVDKLVANGTLKRAGSQLRFVPLNLG